MFSRCSTKNNKTNKQKTPKTKTKKNKFLKIVQKTGKQDKSGALGTQVSRGFEQLVMDHTDESLQAIGQSGIYSQRSTLLHQVFFLKIYLFIYI